MTAPSDEFEDWLEKQPPMTPKEQQETFLGYFSQILDSTPDDQVPELRASILAKYPPGKYGDILTDLIDGHCALQRNSKPNR